MAENAREVYGSLRVGGGNPKSVWWNTEIKAAFKRKKAAWKEMSGARDEDAKERCLRKVKRYIYQIKKEIYEQFGRKMNQDMNGNRKLFWKEVSKPNEGKVESCSRIKNGNGRLALEEVGVRRIWKEYFENFYNRDTREQVTVKMCDFNGIRRGN